MARLSEALTPEQLREIWEKHRLTEGRPPPRVVMYEDLIAGKPAFRRGERAVVLYYPTARTPGGLTGHYVALVRDSGRRARVSYYDSYGLLPEAPKSATADLEGLYSGETTNTLASILKRAMVRGARIEWNEHRHQEMSPAVATCGRHALNRCLFEKLDTDSYHNVLEEICRSSRMSPDELVAREWA